MTSRDYYHTFPQANLTNTAAPYVIRRAIQQFLSQPDPNFVAVLKVPVHDDLLVYRDAAKRLLRAKAFDVADFINGEADEGDTYVSAVWDFEKAVVRSTLKTAAIKKRSILIAPTFDGIIRELRLAADILADTPYKASEKSAKQRADYHD